MAKADALGLNGRTIDGQFRVDEVAGEGDLTLVYKGHHLGLDVPVAVKCLNLPSTLDPKLVPSLVSSFGEGSRVHYELSQGNLYIARSITSGTVFAPAVGAAVPYLVREWLEGCSLSVELARRRAEGASCRPLHEVVELLDPAAQALAYAHGRGVVHTRVHPANLFVTRLAGGATVIKVLDFGVAGAIHDTRRDIARGASSELTLFHPAYAAPEQFDKAIGAVGPWTDVYALALVVLEALRDKPAVTVRATVDLAEAVFDRKNRPTPEALGIRLGPKSSRVLSRAVAVDPKERPPNAGAFWDALNDALFKEGLAPAVPRADERPPRELLSPGLRWPDVLEPEAPTVPRANLAPLEPPRPPEVQPAKPKEAQKLHVPTILGIAPQRGVPVVGSDAASVPPSLPPPLPPPPPPPLSPWPSMAAPVPAPAPAPTPAPAPAPATQPPRSAAFYAALIAVSLVVFAGVASAVFFFSATRAKPQTTAAAASTPPPSPLVASSPAPPRPAPPPATAPSLADSRPAFRLADANAALDAATRGVAQCKRPGGKSGRGLVMVSFSPDDGTVTRAVVQVPFAKKPEGDCVEAMAKAARIQPYKPPSIPIMYQFEIPR